MTHYSLHDPSTDWFQEADLKVIYLCCDINIGWFPEASLSPPSTGLSGIQYLILNVLHLYKICSLWIYPL